MDDRRRGGEPVGDQRLDDLTVAGPGDRPHRGSPVDDAGDVQLPAERGHHRQRAQRLLRAGRTVASQHPGLPCVSSCRLAAILNALVFKVVRDTPEGRQDHVMT